MALTPLRWISATGTRSIRRYRDVKEETSSENFMKQIVDAQWVTTMCLLQLGQIRGVGGILSYRQSWNLYFQFNTNLNLSALNDDKNIYLV